MPIALLKHIPHSGWLFAALLALFALALCPEPPARLLTDKEGWQTNGSPENRIAPLAIPNGYSQLRRSVIESAGAALFRTWTPSHGITSLELSSAPFHPGRYLSIMVTGSSRSADGSVQALIECESNGQRAKIFNGSVNSQVTEAILALPDGWCPGNARLRLSAPTWSENVGVGAVYEISLLSYLKSSFIGRLPYLLASLAVFGVISFAGAALAYRLTRIDDPLPYAFISLGGAALSAFYLTGLFDGAKWRWAGAASVACLAVFASAMAGREARHQTARRLAPYAWIWGLASVAYFAVAGLAVNGLGHWEPNYRFWPAAWSSDNELPWLFAEALRRQWDLSRLLGQWMPTDRPPLMTGAHLLLADVFGGLQSGNDGVYLRGQAYNASAIALNASWAPACAWLLPVLRPGIGWQSRNKILIFLACLPVVVFNTVYGWPKAFGAAFALLSAGVAWQVYQARPQPKPLLCVLFFALGTLSMLAHASTALFLAPLGLLFLCFAAHGNVHGVLAGAALAALLMLGWQLYKADVAPSNDPVTKYALTGDFGFSEPQRSLSAMLAARYAALDFWQWLGIKKTMLLQSFWPVDYAIAPIQMNADFGQGSVDRLRAWDFLMLSKGNLPIPILAGLAAWSALRHPLRGDTPFALMIGVSACAWLLMVVGFFAPLIVHVWPQAALFGLALGGASIVQGQNPKLFMLILSMSMAYTGAVWILSPLHSALDIDVGAGLALVLLGIGAILAPERPSPPTGGRLIR